MAADDLRNRLDMVLDGIPDEFLRSIVYNLFSMERLEWGTAKTTCSQCGHQETQKVKIGTPDYLRITSSLANMLDQGKGKPKDASPSETDDAHLEAVVMRVLERWTTRQVEALEHDLARE